MNPYNNPRPLLFVCKSLEDSKKIDAAILDKTLGYQKLGGQTYLGFFELSYKEIYYNLKTHLGVQDEIHWIPLPPSEVTK